MKMKKNYKRALVVAIGIAVVAIGVGAYYYLSAPDDADRNVIPGSYTLAEVSAARTTLKCWAAIGDGVYDLTLYASRDPGLLALCGTSASEAAEKLVRGSGGLDSLRIGSLSQ